jgi:hypothetical protein
MRGAFPVAEFNILSADLLITSTQFKIDVTLCLRVTNDGLGPDFPAHLPCNMLVVPALPRVWGANLRGTSTQRATLFPLGIDTSICVNIG